MRGRCSWPCMIECTCPMAHATTPAMQARASHLTSLMERSETVSALLDWHVDVDSCKLWSYVGHMQHTPSYSEARMLHLCRRYPARYPRRCQRCTSSDTADRRADVSGV